MINRKKTQRLYQEEGLAVTLRTMVEDLVFGPHDFETYREFDEGGFQDVIFRWAGIDTTQPLGPDDPPYNVQLLSSFMGRSFNNLS